MLFAPGRVHSLPPSFLENWLDGRTVPTLEESAANPADFLKCFPIHEFDRFIGGPSPAKYRCRQGGDRLGAGSRGVSLCQKKSEVRQALRKLFLTQCRSACRRLREGSATKAPRGFNQPTGRSAIKSLPGIGSRATAICGRSLERPGFCEVLD